MRLFHAVLAASGRNLTAEEALAAEIEFRGWMNESDTRGAITPFDLYRFSPSTYLYPGNYKIASDREHIYQARTICESIKAGLIIVNTTTMTIEHEFAIIFVNRPFVILTRHGAGGDDFRILQREGRTLFNIRQDHVLFDSLFVGERVSRRRLIDMIRVYEDDRTQLVDYYLHGTVSYRDSTISVLPAIRLAAIVNPQNFLLRATPPERLTLEAQVVADSIDREFLTIQPQQEGANRWTHTFRYGEEFANVKTSTKIQILQWIVNKYGQTSGYGDKVYFACMSVERNPDGQLVMKRGYIPPVNPALVPVCQEYLESLP